MSFYHKYRPQKFSDLLGQDHVKKTLTNALREQKVGHAYLFSGPRGVGKTTVARLLAKALNCEKAAEKQFEPCNQCVSCKEIILDKSLDVIEIDAASNRGIDEIRDLREKIKFAPSKGKFKVFIIDEVHMLTKEAFNALLKTLEEPPKHAIFVMATTELHKIPATILSRVQSFDFKRASVQGITKYLGIIAQAEKINIDASALALIASAGDGSYRDATSILDQVASVGGQQVKLADVQETLGLAEEKTLTDFIGYLIANDREKALKLIDQLFQDGYDLLEFNHNIIEYLRKIILSQANPLFLASAELTEEQKENIQLLAKNIDSDKVLKMINLFIETALMMKGASIPQLPLEMTVIELCGQEATISKDKEVSGEEKGISSKEKEVNNKDTVTASQDTKPDIQKKGTNTKPEIDSQEKEKNNQEKEENKETKNISKAHIAKPVDSINLKNEWPKVLNEIGSQNRSLYLILKESEPMRIEEDKLFLGIKFKLYMERISDKKNYNLLNNALEKIYGKKYILDFIIDDKIKPVQFASEAPKNAPPVAASKVVNDALEMFG